MNIRTVVHAHLTRERIDVLIAVLAPLVLMLESGYACGWVFANGDLSFTNLNTYLALGRGIFLEGLIFAMFKLVRVFALKGGRGLNTVNLSSTGDLLLRWKKRVNHLNKILKALFWQKGLGWWQ